MAFPVGGLVDLNMWSRIQPILTALFGRFASTTAILCIGGGAAVAGATSWHFSGLDNFFTKSAFWVAQTFIGSGVVVAVMRAIQGADYFENGLRKVLFDDSLPKGPIDYKESWKRLTTGLMRRQFSNLDAEINNIDHSDLVGDSGFYYKSHHRTVAISWKDEKKGLLLIEDIVDAELRTADVGKHVVFENRFKPEADTTMRTSIEVEFSGGYAKKLADSDMGEMDGKHGFSEPLPPSCDIKLKREFRKIQDLNLDPLLIYTGTGLISRPRVTISCGPGLKFYFRKAGMTSDFRVIGAQVDIDGPLSRLEAAYDGLCLRSHGYMIVIVKQ